MTTETTEATGVSELDAFKAKVYEMAQLAKRQHGWCGEIDDILDRLGVEAPPAPPIGEGPSEDGLYMVGDYTFYVIRHTLEGQTHWMHTSLQMSGRYTSQQPCTWAEIVTWVSNMIGGLTPQQVAGSLVKVG